MRRPDLDGRPDEKPHRHVRLERRIPLARGRDTVLYVCVTQEDGHQAWSSPVYVFPRR